MCLEPNPELDALVYCQHTLLQTYRQTYRLLHLEGLVLTQKPC